MYYVIVFVIFSIDNKTIGLNKCIHTPNQKILRHQEDNNSETSGETNTSDSGRGLSDDEINLQKGVYNNIFFDH
jgi:hypothetical protein